LKPLISALFAIFVFFCLPSISLIRSLFLLRTSFGLRSDLVKIAASQNPARRGFGKALKWFAAWSAKIYKGVRNYAEKTKNIRK
jgi:hypothetical protein